MSDGLSDAEIEHLLRTAPEERWQELWDAVDALGAEEEHGRWAVGDWVDTITVDGVEKPVLHMPYVIYGPAIDRTIASIYALGASQPFDWHEWDGLNRYRGGRGLDTAPVAESIRMVTAIVRADRFSEGMILASVEDGTLQATVERLRRWHDDER